MFPCVFIEILWRNTSEWKEADQHVHPPSYKILFTLSTVIAVMLTCTVVDGQKISLKLQSVSTVCHRGLRRGYDKYVITGVVGPRFLVSLKNGWKSSITMQVLTKSAQEFTEICKVFIGPDGIFCVRNSKQDCYCDHLDDITDSAHFTINSFAKMSQSEGVIRAVWKHTNGTSLFSTSNVTLPEIFDSNAASLSLRVNGLPTVHSDNCGRFFVPYAINNIELCCDNTATPCYPRISFNMAIVTENTSQCVNYTFMLYNESFSANVTQSYSVCNLNDYITVATCILNTEGRISTETALLILAMIIFALLITIALIIGIFFTVKGNKPRRPIYVNMKGISSNHQTVEAVVPEYEHLSCVDAKSRDVCHSLKASVSHSV